MSDAEWVLLARLVRPQGRQAKCWRISLPTSRNTSPNASGCFFVSETSHIACAEAKVEHHWLHKGRVVLKFSRVDSIADAENLRGFIVAIPAANGAHPADGDAVYVSDLIGCEVIDVSRGADSVGEITDVDPESAAAGGSPPHGEEVLIPFAKAYLGEMDLEGKRMEMDLPEGLLDINAPISEEERRALNKASERRVKLRTDLMRFDIITIFPDFSPAFLAHGVVKRAYSRACSGRTCTICANFTHDRHRTVDDRPFGGGEGMVLKPEPLAEAVESLGIAPKAEENGAAAETVILLSAQGARFTQAMARELATARPRCADLRAL